MVDSTLLNKYINGEFIEDSLLEKLEDDSEFMKGAIFLSGDKQIYNLCSNNVKMNYELIVFLINKFSSDEKFICQIADYYLDNTEDKSRIFELAIIMSDILSTSELGIKYSSIVNNKYHSLKKLREKYLKKYPNSEKQIGLGFAFVNNLYSSSSIAKKYCAKRFIEELLLTDGFEVYIHNNFNSYDEFERNINNNIINYISYYDSALANYIKLDISILSSIKLSLQSIKNKWKNYNKRQEYRKYFILVDALSLYMMLHDNGQMGEFLMIHYAALKMGILDKVIKFTKFDYNEVIKILNKINADEIVKTSIPDRINFNNCIEIINNIVFKGNLEYAFSDGEEHQICKIIQFNKQGD